MDCFTCHFVLRNRDCSQLSILRPVNRCLLRRTHRAIFRPRRGNVRITVQIIIILKDSSFRTGFRVSETIFRNLGACYKTPCHAFQSAINWPHGLNTEGRKPLPPTPCNLTEYSRNLSGRHTVRWPLNHLLIGPEQPAPPPLFVQNSAAKTDLCRQA